MPRLLIAHVCASVAFAADAPLALQVVVEATPPGATVQVKVYAAAPLRITSGALAMDLDPKVFGPIDRVAAFSATGDAAGWADVTDRHVEAHFQSTSGGIGQLPGVPVFVLSVPVLAEAQPEASAAVTVQAAESDALWRGAGGETYAIAGTPAVFRVAGALSVERVTPASGTELRVAGAGFDASTSIDIDAVSIASTQLVGPREIRVVLAGATELTGKRLRVTNGAGERVDHFLAMPSTPGRPGAGTHLTLPLTPVRLARFGYPTNYRAHVSIALQNQSFAPITVTFFDFLGYFGASKDRWGPDPVLRTITIAPGELSVTDSLTIRPGYVFGGSFYLTASSPIRALGLGTQLDVLGDLSVGVLPPMEVSPASPGFFEPFLTPDPVRWDWQTGTASPPARQVPVAWGGAFTVSISPEVRKWLSITPLQATVGSADSVTLTFTPQIAGLAPGTYTSEVKLSYPLPPALSGVRAPEMTIPVTLNVTATPPLIQPLTGFYGVQLGNNDSAVTVVSTTLRLESEGGSTPFTISTTSGSEGWLSVSPLSGVTPATLTITANRAGLPPYSHTAQLLIKSAANTATVPVTLYPPASHPYFLLPPGGRTLRSYEVAYPKGAITGVSVQTASGGEWLKAIGGSGVSIDAVRIDADAGGLEPGTYEGTVTASSAIRIPVTLNVTGAPSAITAAPAAVSLSAVAGQTVSARVRLASPGSAGLFTLSYLTLGAGTSATVQVVSSAVPSTEATFTTPGKATPAEIEIRASAALAGTYNGFLDISWDGGSLPIPITLTAASAAGQPPTLANVVNAGSQRADALAPRGFITLFGVGFGAAPEAFTLDSNGRPPTTIGGTRVLIDGSPAELLYVSGSQINAVVPAEAGETGTATVQVQYAGVLSTACAVPLAPSAPAIFTLSGKGVGQAAALNQDNSINGAAHPAAAGTVLQFFATGGATLPVTATIGGKEAAVTYHGPAPGLIDGMLQVNAAVPSGIAPAADVPVSIAVGGRPSPAGVTVSVR